MRSHEILRHAVSRVIQTSKDKHGTPMTLIGGETAPTERLLIVLRQAVPSIGHLAEFVLCSGKAMHGGEPVPADGFTVVLWHDHASFVSQAKIVLVLGSALLRV